MRNAHFYDRDETFPYLGDVKQEEAVSLAKELKFKFVRVGQHVCTHYDFW